MNVEDIRDYCLAKSEVTEGFPFGDDTLVFKVQGKVFVLISLPANPLRFNAKCDPDRALELRDEYDGTILPGFHMNKKHWNTIICDSTLSNKLIKELIDHSYDLVHKKHGTKSKAVK